FCFLFDSKESAALHVGIYHFVSSLKSDNCRLPTTLPFGRAASGLELFQKTIARKVGRPHILEHGRLWIERRDDFRCAPPQLMVGQVWLGFERVEHSRR